MLRWCSGSSRNAVRLPSGTSVQLHRNPHFGESPLLRVKAEHISAYQRSRLAQGISGRTINMEVGVLRRMLKRAKVWAAVDEDVKAFPEHARMAEQGGGDVEAARKRAAEPFHGFRFHDLRHQAIIELAEAGAPDATLMALAEHMSRRMLEHYSHVRMAAKRNAVELLQTSLRSRDRQSKRQRENPAVN
jgi:integrase